MRQKLYIAYLLTAFALMPLASLAQSSKRYYVTNPKVETENLPVSSNDGLSWTTPIPLTDALLKAEAGDEIWVKGYPTPDRESPYVTPSQAGFTLKSGVKLYGGFKGDETELDQRQTDGKAYRMSYRTVLTGDIKRNDSPDVQYMIFPGNTKRNDNAIHVLTLDLNPAPSNNSNSLPTVVNGITIIRGHATGTLPTGTTVSDPDKGGGIYVTCSATPSTSTPAFRIEQCFFIGNYATQGGGLYVSPHATHTENIVNRCGFFNNAAGERVDVNNQGGAIWLAGKGKVVNSVVFNNENGGVWLGDNDNQVINTTITRNTGPAVDGAGKYVWNTVVWGNTSPYSTNSKPAFHNSALQNDADNTNGNISLADRNNEEGGPHFASPSLKIGFDRDFDVLNELYPVWTWDPTETTRLVDSGNDNAYNNNVFGLTDLSGHTRKQGIIDIGAYEFQPILPERIRYVKPQSTGDGSGTSWDNASGDLQKMIDYLADNNPLELPGEVWVAAGTYIPYTALSPDVLTSVMFRMRDGISVYGGFAGTEIAKSERKMREGGSGMLWDYANVTILEAADYSEESLNYHQHAWTLSSNSVHVVWFAPWGDNAPAFIHNTTLDGVTIRGGHATGVAGTATLKTGCGAGVYMEGSNTNLTRCIITENYATANGGGLWLKNGTVENSLFYNNNATANGGAVYIENYGLVHRCMLVNNSALNGAAAYLDNTDLKDRDGIDHPEYLILSTCVISNNTGRANGAVYCNQGGVILQSTVTNNYCPMATDAAEKSASQTGGLYLNEYGMVVNSVIWNNRIGANESTAVNVPFYALNPSNGKVNFYYNAISGDNNALWNDILQVQTLKLVDNNASQGDSHSNSVMGPRFSTIDGSAMDSDEKLASTIGVQGTWKTIRYKDNAGTVVTDWNRAIDYYWQPIKGSNLWASGMSLAMMPVEVVLAPEIDLGGGLFAQKPAVGAFHVDKAPIVPQLEEGNTLALYINFTCNNPDHDGHSWETAYRSLNDAILYFSNLSNNSSTTVYRGNATETESYTVTNNTAFVIRVHEGTLWPRYSFINEDPKSASVILRRITAGTGTLRIEGGYRATGNTAERASLDYRTIIDGNTEATNIDDGLYHVITVESNAKVELDGFHVINGNAANTATQQYGAGMLVYDGATVTLSNCIFENHTAVNGAAIYAPSTASLTLTNCMVNNNTNLTDSNPVIHASAGKLTLNHVTVVNNLGAAPEGIGNTGTTSFAAGNSSNNSIDDIATMGGEGGQENFANPTRSQGATLGFSTWLGGYSSFRPLTSSTTAGTKIINQATSTTNTLTTDITGSARNLGGLPDLGAYEADLPEAGTILYVRTPADGGDDNHNGLSWEQAFATLEKALSTAEASNTTVKVEEIWVSEGTYTHKSEETEKIHDQCYAYKFVEGVNVYGGFSKEGTPNKDDRDPKAYETILQPGDINPEEEANNKRVSYGRVLVQERPFSTETVYDGFTLRNGYLFSTYRQDITGNIFNVNTDQVGTTGGAGVYLLGNGVLENCQVTNNLIAVKPHNTNLIQTGTGAGGFHQAGAGVYNNGGTIRNCLITQNKHWHFLARPQNGNTESAWMYGSGLYMNNGNVYNTVISNNSSQVFAEGETGYHEVAVGSVFLVNGNFYNNTIVGNEAHLTQANHVKIAISGIFVYANINMYNCIVSGNRDDIHGNSGSTKLYDYPVAAFTYTNTYQEDSEKVHAFYSCINIAENDPKNLCTTNDMKKYRTSTNKYADPQLDSEYRLQPNSPALNTGIEAIEGIIFPDYDADYTARIKDCTIDMGAYEYDNLANISPKVKGEYAYYYVTQNGKGIRNAGSEANAACAQKLQSVLDAAGEYKKNHPNSKVIVKVAGYPETESSEATFVYHATALAEENNPKSYSYVIPYGVVVEGGYNDLDDDWETDKEGKTYKRDVLTYKTVFSAIHEATATTPAITGYHTVTFGQKPEDWTGSEAQSVIDGIWLTDGSSNSTSGAGNPNIRGGGAIVEAWAHVRNCVVKGCEAIMGGGLYLKPGATVSGTAILSNSAERGGGIYAESEEEDVDGNGSNNNGGNAKRSHLISCTLADNNASNIGGGLYLEDGSAMSTNCVIWGNTAPSDKNVSGVVRKQFKDPQWATVFNIGTTEFYPFNSCFVESQAIPADFENNVMESDGTKYFVDSETLKDYRLKEFSLLIKRGTLKVYHDSLEAEFNVAAQDMQGIDRVQNVPERLDVGAFAYDGGILPEITKENVFTRLFVNPANTVKLTDKERAIDFLGRSFFTPFATLNDALNYVNEVRKKLPDEHKDTKFEILMSGGIYKPSVLRKEFSENVTYSHRLYSFIVPYGVNIYGGFKGNELYACKDMTLDTQEGNKDLKYEPNIIPLLNARSFADFNNNGIEEPWELAEQTILSGEINTSTQSKNVYKVIYTNAPEGAHSPLHDVHLDGLTIKDSETFNKLSDEVEGDEAGRGGGVYSNGADYTISRCRFMNNFAMRGGAVYVRNARLNLIGCTFAGNGTVENPDLTTTDLEPRGGAVYVADINNPSNEIASLYAVNCLFANNETVGKGGAIGTTYNDTKGGTDITIPGDTYRTPIINLMNCTLVRNKAQQNAVVYNNSNKETTETTSRIVNTLVWGNESSEQDASTDLSNFDIRYSASDYNYGGFFAEDNKFHNIPLNSENMHMDGPHFTQPSEQAGVDGYTGTSLWNPIALSMATDKGCGGMNVTYSGETLEETEITGEVTDDENNLTTDSYAQWFIKNDLQEYKEVYMPVYNDENLPRYSGPLDESTGKQGDKPIDIGLYEYRYKTGFDAMPAIYVATEESGNGLGSDWANATSNLRDAIIGAAHPIQENGSRTIYVRDGQYDLPRLSSTGTAFMLDMQNTNMSDNLTIKGACTGNGATQDFSKQSVIRTHHQIIANRLLEVSIPDRQENANGNTVTIEGFTFISDMLNTNSSQESGNGVEASIGKDGKLIMKNCAFRNNQGTGILIKHNEGKALFYNTLIADSENGLGVAETTTGRTVLVNTTFANNKTALTNSNSNTKVGDSNAEVYDSNVEVYNPNVEVYNSVWWNNGGKPTAFNVEERDNKVFENTYNLANEVERAQAIANNTDIINGPNFIDPLNQDNVEARDYRFRPNLTMLNQGKNDHYIKEVLNDGAEDGTSTEIPDEEKALGNKARVVDSRIDIGAYEYEAELQPIVYVKANVVGNTDGKSWTTALTDLQAAADLAGIYTYNHANRNGYVFVHNNVTNTPLHLRLPRTKVYGGMNDELTTFTETDTEEKTKRIVTDLLNKRKGLLEATAHSTLSEVTLTASDALADGFVIGTADSSTDDAPVATVRQGTLATSVVEGNVAGSTTGESTTEAGLLYNTLVKGNVDGVKAVNVTATGNIAEPSGSIAEPNRNANNRMNATADNLYVTDNYWSYQLNETSEDIDKGTDAKTEDCIQKVGHNRDIAGNKRIRNTVDNGCFETWDINRKSDSSNGNDNGSDGVITETDYPRGKSVVYVREGLELLLDNDANYDITAPFNPGVLLLEHQAGLRGNNKPISLTNLVVERKVEAGKADMTYMPFTVTKVTNPYPNTDATTATSVSVKHYDGNARAAYAYTFDSSNGTAWKEVTTSPYSNMGLLLDNTGNSTEARVRFYGEATNTTTTVYTENMSQSLQNVTLKRYNFNETWTSPNGNSNRFTHKENMSWNLFGSPYLCAMNYKDMEYGRVLYGLDGSAYRTVNTETEGQSEGYIPAGDAVFTQTATLKDAESFNVDQPTTNNLKNGTPYQGSEALTISLTRAATGEADNASAADLLQLKAVPTTEARNDFDLSADGVKWMAAGEPQLYALRSGNRYSLLSAVDIEGSLSIGVSVPASGIYTLALPDGCDTYGYDAVVLEDAVTGQTADLLEGSYDFNAPSAGDLGHRFTLRFQRPTDDVESSIRVWSDVRGEVSIAGIASGDLLLFYSASGTLLRQHATTSDQVTLTGFETGIVLVKVVRKGEKAVICKVRVK